MEKMFDALMTVCDIAPLFPPSEPIFEPSGQIGVWVWVILGVIALGVLGIGVKLVVVLVQNLKETKKKK